MTDDSDTPTCQSCGSTMRHISSDLGVRTWICKSEECGIVHRKFGTSASNQGRAMTCDIDWKQKCKRVAEWLGEMWHADDGYPTHRTRYKFNDALIRWPDYTRDDAAAMRLLQRLPQGIKRDPPSQSRYLATLTVDRLRDGRWDVYYPGWDEGYWTCGARHESLDGALVLCACELIGKGYEPRQEDE